MLTGPCGVGGAHVPSTFPGDRTLIEVSDLERRAHALGARPSRYRYITVTLPFKKRLQYQVTPSSELMLSVHGANFAPTPMLTCVYRHAHPCTVLVSYHCAP